MQSTSRTSTAQKGHGGEEERDRPKIVGATVEVTTETRGAPRGAEATPTETTPLLGKSQGGEKPVVVAEHKTVCVGRAQTHVDVRFFSYLVSSPSVHILYNNQVKSLDTLSADQSAVLLECEYAADSPRVWTVKPTGVGINRYQSFRVGKTMLRSNFSLATSRLQPRRARYVYMARPSVPLGWLGRPQARARSFA